MLLFTFNRSRSEIGSGQETEDNCKEEDEDINRNVVTRRGVKVFHLDLGHYVTTGDLKGNQVVGLRQP
jgi:hypothetical protein